MDDDMTPIGGSARFGRPYFRIGAVVVLGASILAAGILGPRPAPSPTSSPKPSLVARNPSPPAPSIASSPSTVERTAKGIEALNGLARVVPPAGQLGTTWLPGHITSGSMAAVGTRLFFITGGDQIQSTDVRSNGDVRELVGVPACQGINQLAAAGHELAYVVTSPGGPTSQVNDCGGAGKVSWSVWLVDLNGGSPRRVAGGIRTATSIDVSEFPIHLALTDTAYAFDRPPASAATLGETVEVHALDGRLLWTSRTDQAVADVMLGGGTLAILTDVFAHATGVANLYTSDAVHPDPVPVGQAARSASLSPDGTHLTWEVAFQPPFPGPDPRDVVIETVDSGSEMPVLALTDGDAPAPLRPTVLSTKRGLIVTWFATTSDGAVHPAVRYAAGGNGAFLPSLQEPVWMSVQGNTLLWVAESADGWSKVAFAVDLASLGLS